MGISVPALVVAAVTIVVAAIFATIVGGVAVALGKIDGVSWPSALSRGAVAFASTLTATLAVLAFVTTSVQ